jgi:hypothetical protein
MFAIIEVADVQDHLGYLLNISKFLSFQSCIGFDYYHFEKACESLIQLGKLHRTHISHN